MKSDPEIVILVEHISREFSIASILKMMLESKYGYNVQIQSIYDTHNLNKISPKILLTPFFRSLNSMIFPFVYKWNQARIINLSYEQVFRSHQIKFREPKGSFVKNEVLHVSWGEDFSKFLLQNGVSVENIVLNGNLQYQLYKYPYRNVSYDRNFLSSKYNISSTKKWILFTENYGAIFGGDKSVTHPLMEDRITSEKVKTFVNKSFVKTMQWIDQISRINDLEIIIRPRPRTNKENLINYYKKINGTINSNIHFIKEDQARDWILSSDIIVSNYSTTLIESALADKKTFMFEPFLFPKYMVSEWYLYVPKIRTFDDFKSCIKNNVLNNSNVEDLKKWAFNTISPNFDVIDNLTTCINEEYENHTPIYRDMMKYFNEDRVKYSIPGSINYNIRKFLRNLLTKVNLIKYYKQDYQSHLEILEQDRITESKVKIEINRWKSIIK